MRPLSVADLAKAMEQDAYDHFSSAGEPSATAADEPVVEILTNADIRRIVGQVGACTYMCIYVHAHLHVNLS